MRMDYGAGTESYHSNIVSNILGLPNQSSIGIYSMTQTDYSCVFNIQNGYLYYGTPEGSNSLNLNPQYVNNLTTPYDYSLSTGTPCIGAGKSGNDMGCYGNLEPGEVVGLITPE